MENIEVFEGLRRRILGKGLIFLNIMQNQGVILYIFPHIYPFAQPLENKGFERNLRAFFLSFQYIILRQNDASFKLSKV